MKRKLVCSGRSSGVEGTAVCKITWREMKVFRKKNKRIRFAFAVEPDLDELGAAASEEAALSAGYFDCMA